LWTRRRLENGARYNSDELIENNKLKLKVGC
jgi:hypothetical protein